MKAFILYFLFGYALAAPLYSSLMGCQTDYPPRPPLPAMHAELRQKFATAFLNSNSAESVVWLNSAKPSGDNKFRQKSNFLYLTGQVSPDYDFAMDMATKQSYMFIPVRSDYYQKWEGVQKTPEIVKQELGIDHVHWQNQTSSVLNSITNNKGKTVFILRGDTFPNMNQYTVDSTKLTSSLSSSRGIKTDDEIQMLAVAGGVSADGHSNIMRDLDITMYEYNIDGLIQYYCATCGLVHQAYPPIVGSGYHGAVLHYNENLAKIGANDIVLIDASGEYYGYSTDITRTIPANGKYSDDQKMVYEIVYEAITECEAMVRPGANWGSINSKANDILARGLLKIGVLKGELSGIMSSGAYRCFYFHGLGHSIGLDVHDVGGLGTLQKNVAFTIEPGVYFNTVAVQECLNNNNRRPYLNMPVIERFLDQQFGGVRIEDSLAVTDSGCRLLSPTPKSIADIEALMNQ